MNSVLKSAMLMLLSMFILTSCAKQEEGEMNEDKKFPTPEQAAAKAKSDLLDAIASQKDLNLGIDVARLREANPAGMIRYAEVDFGRLIASDSVASLADIVGSDKSMITPLVAGNEVVTIVEVGSAGDGWRVTGLANKAISDDLNQTGSVLIPAATVTAYEIPNLQIMVYGVRESSGERYFLNFEQFTLRESVPIAAFYPVVRDRARQFNAQYGDQLRRGNLVK